MIKVVYVDWRDRQFPPEILGVCTKDTMAEKLRDDKVKELVSEGYEIEEEVNVIIEEFELNDDEPVGHPEPSRIPSFCDLKIEERQYGKCRCQYGKY